MSTASITEPSIETSAASDRLTEALEQKLSHPATSPDFDLHAETNAVLKDIGLTTADAGCFEGRSETINGRPPSPAGYAASPFLKMGDPFFRDTRDGRHVVALDIYPQFLVRTLDFLRCSPSTESINNAILKWDAVEIEE